MLCSNQFIMFAGVNSCCCYYFRKTKKKMYGDLNCKNTKKSRMLLHKSP